MQVLEIESKMSVPALRYINKIPKENRYMVYAGEMHGYSTESVAESLHNANKKMRREHLFSESLLCHLIQEGPRIHA